jgi:hypothetical protein
MKLYKYILSTILILGLCVSCDYIASIFTEEVETADVIVKDSINYEYKYDSLLVENKKLQSKIDSLESIKPRVVVKTRTITEIKEDTIIFRDTLKLTSIERRDSIIFKERVTTNPIKQVVFRDQYVIEFNKEKLIKLRLKSKYYVDRDIIRIYNWEKDELYEIGFYSKDDFITRTIKLKGYLFIVEGVSPNYDLDKRLRKMIKF